MTQNSARAELTGPYLRAVEAFRASHEAYVADGARNWIDERLADAFWTLFDAFPESPCHWPAGLGKFEPLFAAVQALSEHWQAYQRKLERHGRARRPIEDQLWQEPLWTCIEALYRELDRLAPAKPNKQPAKSGKRQPPAEAPYLEPVWLLWEQGVPLEQIGRMHGIVDADGKGVPYLVLRLIHEPDTDPATLDPSAPRTPVDYWREGMNETQAAVCLDMPADELTRLWADFEEKFGPPRYMTPDELANYKSEEKYRRREQERVRAGG